jgi:electron transfer flavoprotein alpha subunit
MNNAYQGIWVFGDYRDYFQNRVTLQLIAKGKELAKELETEVTVILLGEKVHQYAMEYIAHGADQIIVVDHPELKDYQVETYTGLVAELVKHYRPEIFIAGATSFGREFFPRLAKRLQTGLSADCLALAIDPQKRLLIQTTPAFGGDLLAEVVTPEHRPQMATVHPGVFKETVHKHSALGRIIYPQIKVERDTRVQLLRSKPDPGRKANIESTPIVIAGGKGLGSAEQFQILFELAELLGAEVGATRPVTRSGWVAEARLIGQTGKTIKPKLLITIGISGALQFTAGLHGAENIIAINRDPQAPIFKMADLGLVGDARMLLPLLLEKLQKRL